MYKIASSSGHLDDEQAHNGKRANREQHSRQEELTRLPRTQLLAFTKSKSEQSSQATRGISSRCKRLFTRRPHVPATFRRRRISPQAVERYQILLAHPRLAHRTRRTHFYRRPFEPSMDAPPAIQMSTRRHRGFARNLKAHVALEAFRRRVRLRAPCAHPNRGRWFPIVRVRVRRRRRR